MKAAVLPTPLIHCTAPIITIGSWTLVRLPKEASLQLPSRGQTMVEGTLNNAPICLPLEPDGAWSHWFKLEPELLQAINAQVGDTVRLSLAPSKNWLEPDVPADIQSALADNKTVQAVWHSITPMARWEWIRWIRSTNNQATRAKRIEVACSKMTAGKRRPCCWNRNLCTEPSVSKNGILLNAD